VNEFLLGIDVGTTFVKAAVVTPGGVERSHRHVRTPWRPASCRTPPPLNTD
jgi:sugar (pentulose or hexulose) kinase